MRRSALAAVVLLLAVTAAPASARPRAIVELAAVSIGHDVRVSGAVRTHGVPARARLVVQQRAHGRWASRRTVRLAALPRGAFLLRWRSGGAARTTVRGIVTAGGRVIGAGAPVRARTAAPVTIGAGCPVSKVVGVRGSNDTRRYRESRTLVEWIRWLDPGTAVAWVPYPARQVASWAPRSFAGRYEVSVRAGIAGLVAQVTAFARACPGIRLSLAGFSQGAQVVGDAYLEWLTDAERARVARLVLFGDPRFRRGQGRPVGAGDYDRRLGGIAAQGNGGHRWPAADAAKVRSYCIKGDPICNFSSVRVATDCAASPYCPHLFYGNDRMPGHGTESYTLVAARFLTGVAHGRGGGGGGFPDTPAPGPVWPAYAHVTPLAPSAGPAGYSFEVAGPPCTPHPDETAEVQVAEDPPGTTHSGGDTTPGRALVDWFIEIDTSRNDEGEHAATVSCLLSGPGGTRVGWAEQVPFTVTGPARPAQLGEPPARAGGDLTLISGAAGGPDPCPAIPTLTPARLIVFPGWAASAGGAIQAMVGMAVPTGQSASVPLPGWVQPGDTGSASAECVYTGGTGAPVPDMAVATFEWTPQPYTVAP